MNEIIIILGIVALLINIGIIFCAYKIFKIANYILVWKKSWIFFIIAIVIFVLYGGVKLFQDTGMYFHPAIEPIFTVHPIFLIIAVFLFLFIHYVAQMFEGITKLNSRSKFTTLLKNLPVGVIIYNKDGSIACANDCSREFLGISGNPEGMFGLDPYPDLHFMAEDGSFLLPRDCPVNVILRTNEPFQHKVFGVNIEGKYKWMLLNGYLTENGNGQVVLVFMDITELREAQKACKASEDLYKNAFMSTHDAVVITNLVTGEIYSVNKSFYNLTGYGTEIIGKSTIDIGLWKNPEDREFWCNELIAKGSIGDLNTYFVSKDGKDIHGLLSSCVLVDNEGHIFTSVKVICEGMKRRKEDKEEESHEQSKEIS